LINYCLKIVYGDFPDFDDGLSKSTVATMVDLRSVLDGLFDSFWLRN